MKTHMNFYVENKPFYDGVEIHARLRTETGFAQAQPLMFREETAEEAAVVPVPCMTITRDSAQDLMDALWDVGIRPTDGTGSTGQLQATERHLEDMRQLVFRGRANES